MDARGAIDTRPNPGPFRCLGCRTYVTGTEAGHCPKCGRVPPRARFDPGDEPAVAEIRPWDLIRSILRGLQLHHVLGLVLFVVNLLLRVYYP